MEKKQCKKVWGIFDCLEKPEFFYNKKAAKKKVLGLIKENNCKVCGPGKAYHQDDYGEYIVAIQGGRGSGTVRFFFQEHDEEEIKAKGFTIS